MSGENSSNTSEPGTHARRDRVSLFRPGQALPRPAVTQDQTREREAISTALVLSAPNPIRVWDSLRPIRLDAKILAGNGLFLNSNSGAASSAFDILRTRLLQAMEARGWRRIAVTSPTHGCGKSFVAANLAFSLSPKTSNRTVLLHLE